MTSDSQDALDVPIHRLWQRAQAGDEGAYREVLSAVAARLRGYFGRRTLGLADEAEDLVQETLLAMHVHRGTHEAAVPVMAWVHAIARHKLVDAWRRHGRREALHDPWDDLPEAQHPLADTADTGRRDVAQLLALLPVAQREAILRTKVEGLSVREAAQLGGVSESALKVSVHRGLKKLAAWMRGEA